MIEYILKRDGSEEPFSSAKVNGWSEWAAQHLGGFVDWAGVAMRAVGSLPTRCSSQDLQLALIQECKAQKSWAYYRMAGRLYVPYLRKEMYGGDGTVPPIREIHRQLSEMGLMRELRYSEAEYQQIENMLEHKRDFNYAEFQIRQIVDKYALMDRRKGISSPNAGRKIESPQHVYMRMAMALAEDEPDDIRMLHVSKWYSHLSCNRLNAPTPNFANLGTTHNGYVSCCLYVCEDTETSLGIGDHIARTMTVASAGIGGALLCRSLNDPVRGGLITHQGRVPYYKALAGAVNSSIQNGRGGACTTYFSCYDPEVMTLMNLRHPNSPVDKRILTMDFAVCTNKHLYRKAAANEDVFTFNIFTAPDLVAAFYSSEPGLFEKVYARYEADPAFVKNYISAREIVIASENIAIETGSLYCFAADEANRHTPFYDPIYSSNLCVAPETQLLTDQGEFEIQTKAGQTVNVWNGRCFSPALVGKTGRNRPLVTVTLSDGKSLDCTHQHHWYVHRPETTSASDTHDIRQESPALEYKKRMTCELRLGDLVEPSRYDETNQEPVRVVKLEDRGRCADTYCVTEYASHKAVFNGILTGNCNEIFEPTAPYQSMVDLYTGGDVGYIRVESRYGENNEYKVIDTFQAAEPVQMANHDSTRTRKAAQELKVGDRYIQCDVFGHDVTLQVKEIQSFKREPEVALCALAAIVPSYIDSEEQYAEVAYYALKMIDKCIHLSEFPLEHVAYTAKQRLSAGVGLTGVAHYMARKHLKYSTIEGKQELHRLAERHAYHVIRASLRLGRELGNAPWIHRTKWPEGWLPIDTYAKTVDSIAPFENQYDWETLRQEIIANGGIRNSVVIAHMPTESSSKASGIPNGLYPIRDFSLAKTDNGKKLDWAPTDGDRLKRFYEIAWDVHWKDQIDVYAIFQKWTDQGISADQWVRLEGDSVVFSKDLLQLGMYKARMGLKGRYYFNSKTSKSVKNETTGEEVVQESIQEFTTSDKCESGGCDA